MRVAVKLAAGAAVALFGTGAPAWAAETKTDPKADTEASAAMERARRQAANPMRVILEASKVRRKTAADGDVVVPAAAATAAVRAPAPATPTTVPVRFSTGTTTGTGNGNGNAVVDRSTSVPAAAQASVRPEASAMPELPPLTTANAALDTTAATTAGAATPTDAAAIPASASASIPVPAAATVSPPQTAALNNAEPVVFRPKLLEMVEPSIPQRVLDEVGRVVELNLDVTIRPDGSVAAVSVLQPAPRAMVRYVVAAVERWRFDRSPSERTHRVQLVFNER